MKSFCLPVADNQFLVATLATRAKAMMLKKALTKVYGIATEVEKCEDGYCIVATYSSGMVSEGRRMEVKASVQDSALVVISIYNQQG